MKILFCTFDSLGFLYPMIGLANNFRRLGCDVGFIGSKKIKQIVYSQEIKWVDNNHTDKDTFLIKTFGNSEDISSQITYTELAQTIFCYDIIFTSPLCYGVLLAAERNNIPVVTLGFFSCLWSNLINDQLMPNKFREHCDWRTRDMINNYIKSREINNFKEKQFNFNCNPLIGNLMLQRNVPSIMSSTQYNHDKIIPFGSCLWEPEQPSNSEEMLQQWLDLPEHRNRKVLYVNQGRVFYMKGFWDSIKSIFVNTEYLIITDINRMDCAIGEVPNNFFLADHIPLRSVVSSASLFISAGHTTTVLAALENAIPMLLLPTGGETIDNSFYCQKIGVALVFDENSYNEQQILDAVKYIVVEQKLKDACLHISKEFAQYKENSFHSDFLKKISSQLIKNKNLI